MRMFRFVSSIAVSSLVAMMIACGTSSTDDTSSPGPAPNNDPPPAAITQTGSPGVVPQVVDAAPQAVDSGPKCDELGNLEGLGIEASYEAGDQWFWGPLANPAAARLGILGSASSASSQGQTVQLGVGPEANYATCTHCFTIAVGCNGDDCSKATWFFAKSGTSRFDHVATSAGETFSGRFDDVTLVQVTVDFANGYQSAEVANGGCYHVTAATFSATTIAIDPLPPDDGGTSDGGGSSVDGGDGGDGGGGGGGNTNNGYHAGGRNGDTGLQKNTSDGSAG